MQFLKLQKLKNILLACLAAAVLILAFCFGSALTSGSKAKTERDELSQKLTELEAQVSSLQADLSSASARIQELEAQTPTPSPSPSAPPSPTPSGELTGYQALFPDLYAEKADFVNRSDQKIAYLTFDDGPSSKTEGILETLKEKDVKATFFVVPKGTGESDDRLKKIAEAGHTIGIHSKTHDYKKIYASVEAFLEDFNAAYQEVVQATGIRPTVFRFPGGSKNSYNKAIYDELVAEMTRRGFVFYDWNVSSEDAAGKTTADSVYDSVAATLKSRQHAQVLLHDSGDKKATAEALPRIIDLLKEKGYTFASLDSTVEPVQF